MSRGLGVEQRRFLHALATLEARHGRNWICVWGVVDAAWSAELDDRHSRREQEREECRAAWRRAEEAREASDRRLAETGDEEAKIRVGHWNTLRVLGGALRRRFRIHYNHLRRNNPGAEAMLNPSRLLAGLERRGLLMRVRGAVLLTDAGRTAALVKAT